MTDDNVIDFFKFANEQKKTQEGSDPLPRDDYRQEVLRKRNWAMAGLQHALVSAVCAHLTAPNWGTPENWTLCDDDDANMAQTLLALQMASITEDIQRASDSVQKLALSAPSMLKAFISEESTMKQFVGLLAERIAKNPDDFREAFQGAKEKADKGEGQ